MATKYICDFCERDVKWSCDLSTIAIQNVPEHRQAFMFYQQACIDCRRKLVGMIKEHDWKPVS